MILEHWLSIGAGIFLIGMMLYGHYRGLLKQCVSLGALVLTIVIVKLSTPYITDFLKDNPSIRKNAGNAILSAAGWEAPADISLYLADMLINAVVSAVLFLIVFILIHLAVKWLDIIARLPIIHGLNHIAGAVMGLAYGLLLLWMALFLMKLFSATPTGGMLIEQVNQSRWLNFLYRYNLLSILFGGIMRGIF